MAKKAFVIMPYDKRFNRLYSIIIEHTLKDRGYECIRQDFSPAGGVIMEQVIRNIADADIAITDLSGWNWNVAYELGIRHSLCRSGTILMCENTYQNNPAFDIKHLSILFYDPDWLSNEGEDKIIAELVKLIEFREQNAAVQDSPVHSCFQQFPEKLIALNGDSVDDSAARIHELENENAQLRERIALAGLDETRGQNPDSYGPSIMAAIKDRIYYSDAAVDRLQELQRAGKIEEFGQFLTEVLDRGFLDEIDCKNVYYLCDRFGAQALTRVFLEYATKQFPENEELNIYLAEEFSKTPKTRDKAVVLANEMVGVSRKNGKYELSTKHVTYSALAAFFNVYLKLKMYDEILKLSPVLFAEYQTNKMQCLIQRNVLRAYLNLEMLDHAEEACKKLMELGPMLDENYQMAYHFFVVTDQYTKAYEAMETCIRIDPKDENYYYRIAGLIFDENVARLSPEEAPEKVDDAAAKRCAVPFILTALQNAGSDRRKQQRALTFLSKNDCQDVIDALQSNADIGISFEMVDYALSKEITPLFEATV